MLLQKLGIHFDDQVRKGKGHPHVILWRDRTEECDVESDRSRFERELRLGRRVFLRNVQVGGSASKPKGHRGGWGTHKSSLVSDQSSPDIHRNRIPHKLISNSIDLDQPCSASTPKISASIPDPTLSSFRTHPPNQPHNPSSSRGKRPANVSPISQPSSHRLDRPVARY